MPYGTYGQSTIPLQSVLSSSSVTDEVVHPHHPITCVGDLWYNEDNSFECKHTKVTADDKRMRSVVNHSIALLIIEEAVKKFGG